MEAATKFALRSVARRYQHLQEEIKELDERTALLLAAADPTGILTSAPGVATITASAILGRLGDPNRFTSLTGAQAFTGPVPILDSSGLTGRHRGPTKRSDAVLRQALFIAASQARRIDPTLAAKYHRLMTEAGKHHNSALCHIATTLLTPIIACWRAGSPTSSATSTALQSASSRRGRSLPTATPYPKTFEPGAKPRPERERTGQARSR